MKQAACRFCHKPLGSVFADLGETPLANAFLTKDRLVVLEKTYPLRVYVCDRCFLVQLEEFESPEAIFSEYAYFSSYSEGWLRHARDYAEKMIRDYGLGSGHQVVEIASNDGYLLQYFQDRGIPSLGIEPAANVAQAAVQKGIATLTKFFGSETARALADEGRQADLLIGNNVLAHVPDLNDFVEGAQLALKPEGIFTFEFPHLLAMIRECQFDTIYHEHFSYLSFTAAEKIFAAHELTLFHVEELPTHGGSLRIYGAHRTAHRAKICGSVADMREKELRAGLNDLETYALFRSRIHKIQKDLVGFLSQASRAGKKVAAYGAAAKGNTLLNSCGVDTEWIEYCVDKSDYKQGLFLPGSHIPVHSPEKVLETRPDYLLILPWNIKEEIMRQMAHVREWGCRFVWAVPELTIAA